MIETIHLFEELKDELIGLLEDLDEEGWKKETCLKGRTVKDLASHIMDTSLRRVSMGRDGYFGEVPADFSREGLIDFIQDQNRRWIDATRRLSPRVLIELLKVSENELIEHLKRLDLRGKALFPVAWAGEEEYSENWFDIAREYTEKWHHQMQIREAVGIEGNLYNKRFLKPVIDTFVAAIPYTYDKYEKEDFVIEVEIAGESGGSYFVEKKDGETRFIDRVECDNRVSISEREFWRLVTNSKDREMVEIEVKGDRGLGRHLLTMVTVMS